MLIVSALLFERPGDPASSTDTDERSRARAANVALAGEGVVTSLSPYLTLFKFWLRITQVFVIPETQTRL
jgi:hypothetical protein